MIRFTYSFLFAFAMTFAGVVSAGVVLLEQSAHADIIAKSSDTPRHGVLSFTRVSDAIDTPLQQQSQQNALAWCGDQWDDAPDLFDINLKAQTSFGRQHSAIAVKLNNALLLSTRYQLGIRGPPQA